MMTLNPSLASPTNLTEIDSPSKPSIYPKNLIGFTHHHHHHHDDHESQSNELSGQVPPRNLRSSVFLLNGTILQSSSSEFDLRTSSNQLLIKSSLDRPNRSNTRPASWILMEDGLYGPPQKQMTDQHIDDVPSHQTNSLSGDSTNSSFMKPNQTAITSHSSTLKASSTHSLLLSINPTPKSNSSYSPLAAFLGSPIQPFSSSSHHANSNSNSNSNLKSNSSNSLLATFLNSGNQSTLNKTRVDQIHSSELHQHKFRAIPHDDQSSKENFMNPVSSHHPHLWLDNSPKNHIQPSNESIKSNQTMITHQEIHKPNPISDQVNHQSIQSKVETCPSAMITPPVSPLKKPMANPVIPNDSFGSKLEVMTRQSSTAPSSTDEFQSLESLSVESNHSQSNDNMKRPVRSVYTEGLIEEEEEVYNSSEQDVRCSTFSSPSSIDETNSTRSERFPITPNSERIRPESDPSSSFKANQLLNEEDETKLPPKLEDILLTSPNRILKRILLNLTYLDFFNLSLTSINLKEEFTNQNEITELILERYLGSLGYCRKPFNSSYHKMTEKITLKDLQSFYTGLEFGNEEIGNLSREMILKNGRGIDKTMIKLIKDGCRAYNRILIHIRENGNHERKRKNGLVVHLGNRMESIWKEGRAGVLKVWVPTRESWMSNEEVVECERELWRSQVWPWLKKGDICWNTGLGEFANEGKLIFDGKYLRDLLFEFDSIGHLPSWLNMMNFPPVYFHRIIESSSSSPIFYLDLSNFGKEVQIRMKLCKDQIEMSSPITRYRVQRWVYRSMIDILPEMLLEKGRGNVKKEMIDLGWVGRIVLEVEGTSECARELLKRCSLEWSRELEKKNGSVSGTIHLTPWRIIREKCGPGKMWIRPVLDDERI